MVWNAEFQKNNILKQIIYLARINPFTFVQETNRKDKE